MAHVSQSRPDSGLGFQEKIFQTFQVPSSLGGGVTLELYLHHQALRTFAITHHSENFKEPDCPDIWARQVTFDVFPKQQSTLGTFPVVL